MAAEKTRILDHRSEGKKEDYFYLFARSIARCCLVGLAVRFALRLTLQLARLATARCYLQKRRKSPPSSFRTVIKDNSYCTGHYPFLNFLFQFNSFFLFLSFLHGFVSLSFAARRRERDHQREGLRAGGRGVARAEPRPRRRSSSRNRIHAGGQSG